MLLRATPGHKKLQNDIKRNYRRTLGLSNYHATLHSNQTAAFVQTIPCCQHMDSFELLPMLIKVPKKG